MADTLLAPSPARRGTLAGLLLAALLLSPAALLAEEIDIEAEARRMDQLFLGPCCYSQTLDVHSSQPSQDLRKEIRRLLKSGKSPAEVEAMVIEEYGMKILAVPPSSILAEVLMLSVAGILLAGFILLWVGRKWARRGQPEDEGEPEEAPSEEDQEYRDRLEDELASLRPEG